jgi:hypothetical protein
MTTLDSLLPRNNCDTRVINQESEGVRRAIEINIQLMILQTLEGIAGSLSGGGATANYFVTSGNYSGGQPNFTPTQPNGIAFDTSTGTQWSWYNGSWH